MKQKQVYACTKCGAAKMSPADFCTSPHCEWGKDHAPKVSAPKLLADELDAELHRCWTKHVNAPYDKRAFQALQDKVEKACTALRKQELYVRGEGLQEAISQTYAHAKPAADCNQSDSVMPRERVEAMLRAYVGEPQQGSTSLLCDCKHGGFRKGTCGDCPHTSSSISDSPTKEGS